MILPISVYGDQVLRRSVDPVERTYDGLSTLIENMFQTMYNADGVGLAAPQVGLSIGLFVIDGSPAADDNDPDLKNFKKAFINPNILETSEDEIVMEEGCLSVPNIHENVSRPVSVKIHYFDENWVEHTDTFSGYAARIVQHEYDHLLGHVFVDHISPLKRRILKSKLMAIAQGKTKPGYFTRSPK